MKKIIKKGKTLGFTLTELVIVIVIIAILAMVLIPTYTGYVNRAKDTVDTTLIKTLNDYCREGENLPEYSTANLTDVFEMIDDLSEGAYNKDNIKTSLSSNTLVWNQTTNRFYILTKNGTEDVISTRDDSEPVVPFGQVTYWLMYTKDNEYVKINEDTIESKYSVYLATTVSNTILNTTTGLDLGENTSVKTIKYTNESTSAQTVLMVTNAFDQVLTVNASLDTVKHYGKIGYVGISAIAQSCYEEYGTTTFIECASGKVVAEEGSVIDTVLVTGNSSNTSLTMSAYDAKSDADKAAANANAGTVMNNGGTIIHAYATTNVTATLNNDQSSLNVPLTLATSSSDLNDVLVFADSNTVVASSEIKTATNNLLAGTSLSEETKAAAKEASEANNTPAYSWTYDEDANIGTHKKVVNGTVYTEVCQLGDDYICTECGHELQPGIYGVANNEKYFYAFGDSGDFSGVAGYEKVDVNFKDFFDTALKSIQYKDPVTKDNVTMIVLPNDVTGIDPATYDTADTKVFDFPNLKTLIAIKLGSIYSSYQRNYYGGWSYEGAFYKCVNLTYVYMPELAEIARNSFATCSNLTARFDSLVSVDRYAFQGSATSENKPNISIKYYEYVWNGDTYVHTSFIYNGNFILTDYTFYGTEEQLLKAYSTEDISFQFAEKDKADYGYYVRYDQYSKTIVMTTEGGTSGYDGLTLNVTVVDDNNNISTMHVHFVSSSAYVGASIDSDEQIWFDVTSYESQFSSFTAEATPEGLQGENWQVSNEVEIPITVEGSTKTYKVKLHKETQLGIIYYTAIEK